MVWKWLLAFGFAACVAIGTVVFALARPNGDSGEGPEQTCSAEDAVSWSGRVYSGLDLAWERVPIRVSDKTVKAEAPCEERPAQLLRLIEDVPARIALSGVSGPTRTLYIASGSFFVARDHPLRRAVPRDLLRPVRRRTSCARPFTRTGRVLSVQLLGFSVRLNYGPGRSQSIRIDTDTDLGAVDRVEGVRVLEAGVRVKVRGLICEDSRKPLAVRLTPL